MNHRLEGLCLVLIGDFHPELHVLVALVGEEGLGDDGIEYDLALDVEERAEYGGSLCGLPVFPFEHVDVLRHEALQEGLRVGAPDREHLPVVQPSDPTT